MKKVVYLSFVVLFSFCGGKKSTINSESLSKAELKSNCPDNGICTLEFLKNKTLLIKKDEFDKTYYELADSKTSSVVFYQYKRKNKENLPDGNYTEEILFEIDNSAKNYSLVNTDLQKVKMIFGRLCFCRGQTGYYNVNEGSLNYKKTNNEIELDLNFKIPQVPQVITSFSATIK